jgi:hypothetical protein
MNSDLMEWKWGIFYGLAAGILWGWVTITVNTLTGAFLFEQGLGHTLLTFSTAGAFFGVVTAGFLMLTRNRIPLKGIIPKAILISTGLWFALRLTGFILSSVSPGRFHFVLTQTLQGIALAVVLGGILGTMWKVKRI